MKIANKDLKRRIIEISYKYKLSHLGSCLTAVDIIEEIYQTKEPKEKFVLSSGHAGLALYCVIEKHEGIDAERIFNHHGVHPDRCEKCHLYCSTGSLGQGLPIAVGMALATQYKNVYCLASDGELQEGSTHEAAEIMWNQKTTNLKVYVNSNEWGAYKQIDQKHLMKRFSAYYDQNIFFRNTNVNDFPFLQGQDAHYKVMSEEEYIEALEILK